MTAENHTLATWGDIPAALGLLTRLPVRVNTEAALARGARAAWAWPLAGLAVAALAAFAATLALWVGLGPALAATLALTTQIAVTGALHEDGLADSLDGLWGGWDRARRLEIMKDSRIGAYGVIGLILTLLIRWQALTLLIDADALWPALLTLGAASRVPMIAVMTFLPPARDTGLSRSVGRPPRAALWLGLALATGTAALLLGAAILPLAIVVTLTTLAWSRIAIARIGGQTGDILGAAQQLAEIAGLLTLAALLT